MKKIIIGRNKACDIIIPDTTDLVSRKQAILSVSFFGKKYLYDTSSNGTFINGKKLEKGIGEPVTRKDKINFANVRDFDWNSYKDPYRKIKIIASISIGLLIAAIVLLLIFIPQVPVQENPITTPEETVMPMESETPKDSIETIVPEKGPTYTTVDPSRQKQAVPMKKNRSSLNKNSKDNKNNKTNKTTPEKDKEKEVNNNSPIVY